MGSALDMEHNAEKWGQPLTWDITEKWGQPLTWDITEKWGQPLTWDIMLAMVNAGGIILDYGQTTEN
jgi:hypothetical protein